MKTYQISISSADLPYVMEAITLRALTLQQSINNQIVAFEEAERKRQDEARRAALPDPFENDMDIPVTKVELTKPIIVPKAPTDISEHIKEVAKVSRKQKRAALMRILKAKSSADLSTAEIARRAGVSYVTAHKARAAFAPKKGRK